MAGKVPIALVMEARECFRRDSGALRAGAIQEVVPFLQGLSFYFYFIYFKVYLFILRESLCRIINYERRRKGGREREKQENKRYARMKALRMDREGKCSQSS